MCAFLYHDPYFLLLSGSWWTQTLSHPHLWPNQASENSNLCLYTSPSCWPLKKEREVAQLCPTLCDPMDCSLPGSSVRGIFQARILEWVAISFTKDLPKPVIEPRSPALEADALLSEPPRKPLGEFKTLLWVLWFFAQLRVNQGEGNGNLL